MRIDRFWEDFGRRFAITPPIAIGAAVLLVAAAFGLGLYNEHLSNTERVRQVAVQADILAGSVAAPLAFDDAEAAREYVNAMKAGPQVEAVAAYGESGVLAAGFTRMGEPPPVTNRVGPPVVREGHVVVTREVTQGDARLGSVYLRVAAESFARRAARYLGIGLLVIMAALLVAVLGASHAALAEAHRRLQAESAEREKAEAALRQAHKMEAMGQLTGGVAHDFNNLLMAASGGLDLMERTSDPARRDRLMQGIRHALERGASLTQQLLAFARRAPLKSEVVDLDEGLKRTAELLARSLREDITVEFRIAPDLWPVEVDPAQLEVAILNVALNARDAMPNGGTITIEAENLSLSDGREMVRLSIADTGSGIDPEVLSRVFEPFFTTKRVGEGTGLGLSQVYGFARSSGGEVQIESEPGRGARLSILLPRSQAAPAPRRGPPPRGAALAERRRVLLVEDDDSVAEFVAEMLAELGYESTRASTGAEALDVLRLEGAFDLVFSDMIMPGEIGGLELAREIGRRRPDLPVVLTTGYSAAAAEAAAEGIHLLVKPYRIDSLEAELSSALAEGSGAAAGR